MQPSTWNSLEIVKLIAEGLTPLVVLLIGFWINRSVRRVENSQWFNQKLIEKRIALLDEVLPDLNDLYCYFLQVGVWKELSPPDIIARKRRLDRVFHAYRPFFPTATMNTYRSYSDALFRSFNGAGTDAQLRTAVASLDGDRAVAFPAWQPEWNALFVTDQEQTSRRDVRDTYQALLDQLGADVSPNADVAARP